MTGWSEYFHYPGQSSLRAIGVTGKKAGSNRRTDVVLMATKFFKQWGAKTGHFGSKIQV
jgi:hypothetical protein